MTTDPSRAEELVQTVKRAQLGIEDTINNAGYLTQHLAATRLYAEPAFDLLEAKEFRHVHWAAKEALLRARWVVSDLEGFMGHVQALADAADAGEEW